MRINLKLITILSIFSLVLYGCSNDMKKMNEVFNEFEKEIEEGSYKFVGSVDGSDIEIDYTDDKNFTFEINNELGGYNYICSDSDDSSAWINGENHTEYLEMDQICSSGEVTEIVNDIFKAINDSSFFNDKYDVEYTLDGDTYKASGKYSNGESFSLKINKEGNKLYFKNSSSEIELTLVK